jgi:hypothetical protein
MRDRTKINLNVVSDDKFLDMSHEAQSLYFHLVLRAENDGAIKNAKRVIREVNGKEMCLELLISKGYISKYFDGTYGVTDWEKHIG